LKQLELVQHSLHVLELLVARPKLDAGFDGYRCDCGVGKRDGDALGAKGREIVPDAIPP
jgi:hypothetical protein